MAWQGLLDLFADRRLVVAALADRHGEALALGQDHADRADAGGAVGEGEVGVAELAGFAVDVDAAAEDAAPAHGEDVLAIDVARGGDAQAAHDAAVEVEQHVGVRGVHRAVGIEHVEVRRHHLQFVGRGLQRAVAALFAGRAEVVAFDEEHLQQGAALVVEFGVRFSTTMPACAAMVQEEPKRPLTLTVHSLQEPCALKSGCQHRCGIYTPAALAACMMVCPGVKGMSSPSSWKVGSSCFGLVACRWAAASSRPVICRACDSAASRSKAGS
jgi:hypothetical protein